MDADMLRAYSSCTGQDESENWLLVVVHQQTRRL